MSQTKLVLWNANGWQQHAFELGTFLEINKIDIALISETHFTDKSYVRIPHFNVYTTNHPAGTARGGTAIIVRESISHTLNQNYQTHHIQATSITISVSCGPITIAAVYCPPRHTISNEQYQHFFKSLGNFYFEGGDYNAKHTLWGS